MIFQLSSVLVLGMLNVGLFEANFLAVALLPKNFAFA